MNVLPSEKGKGKVWRLAITQRLGLTYKDTCFWMCVLSSERADGVSWLIDWRESLDCLKWHTKTVDLASENQDVLLACASSIADMAQHMSDCSQWSSMEEDVPCNVADVIWKMHTLSQTEPYASSKCKAQIWLIIVKQKGSGSARHRSTHRLHCALLSEKTKKSVWQLRLLQESAKSCRRGSRHHLILHTVCQRRRRACLTAFTSAQKGTGPCRRGSRYLAGLCPLSVR